jgi:hypothetical protein
MRPITAIALFCEDIRDEKLGTESLVGILPDNLAIGGPAGGFLPKLAIYLRLQLENEVDIKTISARVIFPGGRVIEMATFDPDAVKSAKEQSKANGIPYTGLIGKALMTPVPIEALGKIEVIVTADGEDFVCGILNIVTAADAPSGS